MAILEYQNENINEELLTAVVMSYGVITDISENNNTLTVITFNDDSDIIRYILENDGKMVFNRYKAVEEMI